MLFHDKVEVEVAWGVDAPSCGNGFAFGSGLVAGGRLFFRGHGFFGVFLRKGLRGEKSKSRDSNLNESISLWW